MLEDEAARGRGEKMVLRAGREAAIYLLNKKRLEVGEIEQRYGVSIEVIIDESLEGARMSVESSGPRPVVPQRSEAAPAPIEDDDDEFEEEEEDEAALVGAEEFAEEHSDAPVRQDRDRGRDRERGRDDEGESSGRRRRRRRRGGRGRGRRDGQPLAAHEDQSDGSVEAASAESHEDVPTDEPRFETAEADETAHKERPKRRRGRKGSGGAEVEAERSPMVERPIADEEAIAVTKAPDEPFDQPEPAEPEAPRARRRPRARKLEAAPVAASSTPESEPSPEPDPAPTKPVRKRRSKAAATDALAPAERSERVSEPGPAAASVPTPDNDSVMTDDDGEPRRGWWQRTFG
jgi:ribonuclease E